MKETKFKNTEIGRIPEEWEVSPLVDLCLQITDGSHESPIEAEYGHYMPSVKDMYTNGFNFASCKKISEKDYQRLVNNGCKPQKGDVLIAKDGSILKYSFDLKEDLPIVLLSSIAIIRPCHSEIDSGYLALFFRQPMFIERVLANFKTGTGVPRIVLRNFEKIHISYPYDLTEQHHIASALTSIDNLISSLGKLIEKKKNIKQGAMQQLLTGKTRLKGFNEPWMEKKLGDIGSLAMCKRIFQEETSEKGDVPFYKIGTFGQQADAYITKGKYEQFKQMYRFPQKGDVLISAAGTIGRTVIYNGEPAYFQDSNIVWLAHNGKYITNNFLFYIYQRTDWNTEDTTIARLYNNNFNNTCIHFPSSITEQQAIANILSKMDNEITALEIKKAKYEAIKQGMMQQLLTGKIRLIS